MHKEQHWLSSELSFFYPLRIFLCAIHKEQMNKTPDCYPLCNKIVFGRIALRTFERGAAPFEQRFER
jgi:hypothetical protein